jgi:hypothetical protein
MLREHLCSQRRTEVRIVLTDQRQRVISDARVDPIVGRSSTGPVGQCRTAADLKPLQHPMDVPHADRQNPGGRRNRTPVSNHLRQNTDAPHIALAHGHPAQVSPPDRPVRPGRLTFLLCSGVTF